MQAERPGRGGGTLGGVDDADGNVVPGEVNGQREPGRAGACDEYGVGHLRYDTVPITNCQVGVEFVVTTSRPTAVMAKPGRCDERCVADAVRAGLSNAESAATQFMNVATVKSHVSRELAKLGATKRVQIALAIRDAE